MSPADDRSKCAVLMPVAVSIEPETEAAVRELSDRGYKVRLLKGASQIDLARSMMATQAMRDGFAETMWIDSDVVFDPDDVDKLRAHGRPLTAGLYPKKTLPEFAGKFRPGRPMVTFGVGGGLLEMEYVGFGFTHVRAEVYAKIERDWKLPTCGGGYGGATVVPYFIPTLSNESDGLCYLSEDYSFCHRARQVGFPAFADTTIRLGHVGRHIFGWEDLVDRPRLDQLQVGVVQPILKAGG